MPRAVVHRPLRLGTPIEKGADVRALQGQINEAYDKFKIDRQIAQDGDFGGETWDAALEVAFSLGICGAAQGKLRRNVLSEGAQKLIRGRKPDKAEQEAGQRRKDYREKLRARYAKSAGERAIERSNDLVGLKEDPPGSNWGGKVQEMIVYTGYDEPVYWCGCCACWIVVKLGGAKIPNRIRLGFAEYITNDALAGVNGLRAVPVEKARPGDIVCLWGGEHIEVVRKPYDGSGYLETRGGNTTAGGQSSNGGEVADNRRLIGDVDRGRAARPNWN